MKNKNNNKNNKEDNTSIDKIGGIEVSGLITKIRAYAIKNAYEHDYKANLNAVVSKLVSIYPDLKQDIKLLISYVKPIIDEINSLPSDVIISEYKRFSKLFNWDIDTKTEQNKTKELKPLDHVRPNKPVIMRFEPSPSGPLHIGHAYTFGLNILYTRKYNGKLILRISDTNPLNIYPKAYEMIRQDAEWLANKKINDYDFMYIIQSDRMLLYYSYAEKMIKKGIAYVCTCTQEQFLNYKMQGKECPCRSLPIEAHLARWEKMFNIYKPGEAVLRFKSGMQHKNPAMRDFPLMRIIDAEHPRQGKKYRVWPLMNFSVFVDDTELGVTHVLRAKDHMDNARKQEMMYRALGLEPPHTLFVGTINFIGFDLSTSKTRQRIESGYYEDWDDIRLPFLRALRRRGYRPETFLEYAKLVGVSETDKKITKEEFFKMIDSINKQFIEPVSPRFFFLSNPKLIQLQSLDTDKPLRLELDLHPDHKKGGRILKIHNNKLLIDEKDYTTIISSSSKLLIRFMGFCNVMFIPEQREFRFISKDYDYYKTYKGKKMIIHYLPNDENQYIKADVLMPDENKTLIKGIIEHNVKNVLHIDDTAQLERFGFVRLDEIDNDGYHFFYAHR